MKTDLRAAFAWASTHIDSRTRDCRLLALQYACFGLNGSPEHRSVAALCAAHGVPKTSFLRNVDRVGATFGLRPPAAKR